MAVNAKTLEADLVNANTAAGGLGFNARYSITRGLTDPAYLLEGPGIYEIVSGTAREIHDTLTGVAFGLSAANAARSENQESDG